MPHNAMKPFKIVQTSLKNTSFLEPKVVDYLYSLSTRKFVNHALTINQYFFTTLKDIHLNPYKILIFET